MYEEFNGVKTIKISVELVESMTVSDFEQLFDEMLNNSGIECTYEIVDYYS